jgi:SAM-dependent methyltransferase
MRECVRRYHPSNADFRRRHGLAWQSCAVAGVGRTADGMIDAVRSALYDGYAEWYDENIAPFGLAATDTIRRLLGSGRGRCLDLGCGTGLHLPTLIDLGWSVAAVDISEDQLRLARERVGDKVELVPADASELPFPDGTFDAVFSAFTHTDVDDFEGLLREAARVLREGARFVYVGLHPCFIGPHSRFVAAEGVPTLHFGYRERRRYTEAPGISPEGLRAKVGAVHIPLGEFVQAFLDAGLQLERFEEVGERLYPPIIALRARR